MCDDNSMRHCKAFLRRRLAYGPQVSKRERAASHPDGEEQGASAWGHLWPSGRHTQCEELRRVLRRTIFDRQSQSALLLGNTGTGKSLVLDSVLRSLAQEASSLAKAKGATAAASAGHGKRKRQKKNSPAAGEGGGTGGSGGVSSVEGGSAGQPASSSPHRNLAMMVDSMKTGAVNGVPVVFVLDEFERFACRKPQTLLYALLDLCQDKTICAAVVGLSVNLNVLDVAEKRVKSRFSFRQIGFPRQALDTIVSILAGALTLPGGNDENDDDEGGESPPPPPGVSAAFARDFNAVTRQTLGGAKNGVTSSAANSGGGGGGGGAQRSASSALPDLKDLAASGRSVGWLLRLASTAVGLLRDDEKGVTRRALARAGEMLAPDSHSLALRSLSVTQALVLVAMVRLERRGRKKDGCSFEAVFREYGSYLREFRTCHLRFSRAVIFKAFSQLVEQGALRSAEPGTGGGREAHPVLHCRFRSHFDIEQVERALEKNVIAAPTNVARWCKRWQRQ
ncbi:conserved unknown protein [Ectocarpus siliculosus]|uniref:Uncharacterized protein n=1 Tax=Ectocarpus siliculosus TaxID=2880 RepID=D7G0P2_ECTSI|nr:conserved unknown protein [Ectocarpus siliculosus]|eukprot:CBJ33071.1 conserved unknown protein [Ectocarpus siliculosus]